MEVSVPLTKRNFRRANSSAFRSQKRLGLKGSANRPGGALSLQCSGWCEGKWCAGFKFTNSEQVAMPPAAVPLHLWVASPIITALKEAPQRYWLISATPTATPGQIQPGLAGGGRSQRDQLSTSQPLKPTPCNELPAGCVFWGPPS